MYIKKRKVGSKKKVRPWGRTPLFLRPYFCSFFNVIPKKSKIVQGPTFRVGSFTLETYTGPYFSGVLHTQGPTFRAPFFANWHCSGPMQASEQFRGQSAEIWVQRAGRYFQYAAPARAIWALIPTGMLIYVSYNTIARQTALIVYFKSIIKTQQNIEGTHFQSKVKKISF